MPERIFGTLDEEGRRMKNEPLDITLKYRLVGFPAFNTWPMLDFGA